MKRPLVLCAIVAFVIALGAAHRAAAQDATPIPYPSADPHTYDDPGMHFEAPAGYRLIARVLLPLSDLGSKAIVAQWVKDPGQTGERTLTIQVEQYSGDVDQFKTSATNDIRDNIDSAMITKMERTQTPNGMPAYFISVTSGSGFTEQKLYELLWADGTRGVTIGLTGAIGELSEAEARTTLFNVSAVRYPADRE